MTDARQLVERAVEALITGNLAQHLSEVAPDVTARMNENPPVFGIAAYEKLLKLMLSTEVFRGFRVIRVTVSGNEVTVDLAQEQYVPTAGISEVVPSSYVVRDNQIVQVRFTALAGPRRSFHYP